MVRTITGRKALGGRTVAEEPALARYEERRNESQRFLYHTRQVFTATRVGSMNCWDEPFKGGMCDSVIVVTDAARQP